MIKRIKVWIRRKLFNEFAKQLRKDSEYYYSWQANIAMAFKDEYDSCDKKYKNRQDIHEIANKGAKRFLNLITYLGRIK